MADYSTRLKSKMEKVDEKEDPSIPPSPYAPIGSDEDVSLRHPVQRQEGSEGPQFFPALLPPWETW